MYILMSHIFIILVSIPLFLKKIPPNRFYGVRVPLSMKSEANWYFVNSIGGRWLIIWGVIGILLNIIFILKNDEWTNIKLSWVTTLIYLIPLIQVLLLTEGSLK